MPRKHSLVHSLLLSLLCLVLLFAAPEGTAHAQSATPTRTPRSTRTPRISATRTRRATRTPTRTRSATRTPTPAVELFTIECSVTARMLNLRSGPGTSFRAVDALARGTLFIAQERTESGDRLSGEAPQAEGWTSASFLDCDGDIEDLPAATVQRSAAATVAATATRRSSQRATPTPAATPAPAATPTPQQQAAPPAPAGGSVTLLAPLEPVLAGRQTFSWQSTVSLEAGQAFELVFWEPGQDPMAGGFGPVGAQSESQVSVDLTKAARFIPQLQPGKSYEWGILLVETSPYRRVAYLGGNQPFELAGAGGGSGGGGGGGDDGGSVEPPK